MERVLATAASTALLRFGHDNIGVTTGSRRRSSRRSRVAAAQNSDNNQESQLDLSVLRFTLGIPGLDESYLPRWLGVSFGSLIVLNHFLSSSPTPAQLRSEALGICLASFSAVLPYLGKFLKGANPVDHLPLPEGNKQIFILSENLSNIQKEDLAWASYVLLRNTNTMSVLIAVHDAICVRGYWNAPEDVSKAQLLEWFKSQIEQVGFLDLKDTLYFPQSPDSQLQKMLPKGALSVLVVPLFGDPDGDTNITTKIEGLVLLASNANYAYSDRDRSWIRAIANKFQVDESAKQFLEVRSEFEISVYFSWTQGKLVDYKNFSKPYIRFCKKLEVRTQKFVHVSCKLS